MSQNFNRRQFLAVSGTSMTLAAATGGLATKKTLASAVSPHESYVAADDMRAIFDISLAEWSLHRALQSGKIDNLDFPVVAREEFDIDGVEYVNQFFKDKARYFPSLALSLKN